MRFIGASYPRRTSLATPGQRCYAPATSAPFRRHIPVSSGLPRRSHTMSGGEGMVGRRLRHIVAVAIALFALAVPRVGADHDRLGDGNGQGPAGGRHPRRDRHADQRNARHEAARRVHERERRLRVRQRPARPLHGPGDDGRLQDAQADAASSSAPATACRSARSRSKSAAPTETVDGQGEAPRPDAQRRALLHGRHRRGREPADRQPQLHRAGLACARRDEHGNDADAHRRRRRHQHHDGRRVGDGHRQQPAAVRR